MMLRASHRWGTYSSRRRAAAGGGAQGVFQAEVDRLRPRGEQGLELQEVALEQVPTDHGGDEGEARADEVEDHLPGEPRAPQRVEIGRPVEVLAHEAVDAHVEQVQG